MICLGKIVCYFILPVVLVESLSKADTKTKQEITVTGSLELKYREFSNIRENFCLEEVSKCAAF